MSAPLAIKLMKLSFSLLYSNKKCKEKRILKGRIFAAPLHTGRQQNRFCYPNVSTGTECHVKIGDTFLYSNKKIILSGVMFVKPLR